MFIEARLRGELARIAASADSRPKKVRRCLRLVGRVQRRIDTLKRVADSAVERGELGRGRRMREALGRLTAFVELARSAARKWLAPPPAGPWAGVTPQPTWVSAREHKGRPSDWSKNR